MTVEANSFLAEKTLPDPVLHNLKHDVAPSSVVSASQIRLEEQGHF